ncbi:MAG: hypothetical protein AB8H86_32465 [Polyangiales bacterium]
MQNIKPWVSSRAIAKFAPDEETIFLMKPPFSPIATLIQHGDPFWTRPCAVPEALDHAQAIMIGDFGIGADSPIVLDYRRSPLDPSVLRLKWSWSQDREPRNNWVEVAATFALFVEMLGL